MSSVRMESCDTQSDEDEDILVINLTQEDVSVAIVADDKWLTELSILSQHVEFRIDTGAKCNTMTNYGGD